MTTTVGVTTDSAQENWPAWAVPRGAVEEWSALQVAIRELGRPPACEADPEAWWPPGRPRAAESERFAAAVDACGACLVRELCAAYAVAAGERDGVWGGLTPADRAAET